MTDRIQNGLEVTRKAIQEGDVSSLRRCLLQFKKLNTPIEVIQDVIAECPISLFRGTGYQLKVYSKLFNKEIVIGKDITYEALEGF